MGTASCFRAIISPLSLAIARGVVFFDILYCGMMLYVYSVAYSICCIRLRRLSCSLLRSTLWRCLNLPALGPFQRLAYSNVVGRHDDDFELTLIHKSHTETSCSQPRQVRRPAASTMSSPLHLNLPVGGSIRWRLLSV